MLRVIAIITLAISSPLPTGIQNRQPMPRADFTVFRTPTKNTVTVGGDCSYSITIHQLGPWINAVHLSIEGLPKQASAEFSPNPIAVGNYTSTLKILTTPGLSPGTYTLKITGRVITRNPTASGLKVVKCKLRVINAGPPKKEGRLFKGIPLLDFGHPSHEDMAPAHTTNCATSKIPLGAVAVSDFTTPSR